MATGDGKYCTLAQLQQYGIGTRTNPANPTVFNQGVTGTPDDELLSDAILRAEANFEKRCGTGFDQQSLTNVQAFIPFIDRNGWVHLFARERGPVTAVTSLQLRDISSGGSYQTVTWGVDDIILPPYDVTHPSPESWHVRIFPAQAQPNLSTGQLLARWSYTGGYATIPDALTNVIARFAWWIYKLREAPVEKVVNMPLGTLTVPLNVPPDILADVELWKPVYA